MFATYGWLGDWVTCGATHSFRRKQSRFATLAQRAVRRKAQTSVINAWGDPRQRGLGNAHRWGLGEGLPFRPKILPRYMRTSPLSSPERSESPARPIFSICIILFWISYNIPLGKPGTSICRRKDGQGHTYRP